MRALVEQLFEGNLRAAARIARLVDERAPGFEELLRELYPRTGNAWLVGVTGNPGAGKSTLVDQLIALARSEGRRVGVIAIDPTSPFTRGAILGDRIRMQRHFQDPSVFIRSVATRGALGGLSRSTADLTRVLEAWGAELILIETVGVGQDEVEIIGLAHTTLVVCAPGLGDGIQAIKAGLLECGDVFAVNKADRDGAAATAKDLEVMIGLADDHAADAPTTHAALRGAHAAPTTPTRWVPPVLLCEAHRGRGMAELHAALAEHRTWLASSSEGTRRLRSRVEHELRLLLRESLLARASAVIEAHWTDTVDAIVEGRLDPYSAEQQLLAAIDARA